MSRFLAVVGVTVLAIAACGDNDDGDAAVLADVERYCEIVHQLPEPAFDLDLEAGPPEPEVVRTGLEDFLDTHGDELDELESVAPADIADVVKDLNAAMREFVRTGDLAAFEETDAAEEKLQEFEDRECKAGSGTPRVQAFCDFMAQGHATGAPPDAEGFRELEALAPEEVRDDVSLAAELFRENGPAAFDDPEFQRIEVAIEQWETENCPSRG